VPQKTKSIPLAKRRRYEYRQKREYRCRECTYAYTSKAARSATNLYDVYTSFKTKQKTTAKMQSFVCIVCRRLSLRELRSTTSLLQAVLLSFLRTRVTRQEAFLLECGTATFFSLEKGTRDTKTDSACLASVATADNVDHNVVFSRDTEQFGGLFYDVLHRTLGEVIVQSAIVDDNRSVATRDQTYAGDCLFTSTRTPELDFLFNVCFCHNSSSP